MNESQFEAELRALPPTAPSPLLEERIALALQEASAQELNARRAFLPAAAVISRRPDRSRWSFGPSWGWALAGAAACVALTVSVLPARRGEAPSVSASAAVTKAVPPSAAVAEEEALFEPENVQSEMLAAEEGEIVYDDDHQPSQLVRYSSLERRSWTNRATGARVELEMPREDLLLVPLAYQ